MTTSNLPNASQLYQAFLAAASSVQMQATINQYHMSSLSEAFLI